MNRILVYTPHTGTSPSDGAYQSKLNALTVGSLRGTISQSALRAAARYDSEVFPGLSLIPIVD